MRIDERLAAGAEPSFSFEFFPPRTDAGERNLGRALAELVRLEPTFVSVTYGAGGTTDQKRKTVDIVRNIKAQHGLEAMAHFTCVGATVDELRDTLDLMRDAGIENVLALRGDPPAGQGEWTATEGGLSYSRELIEMIRADYDFAIGAACFPEVHIHAESADSDLRYLKAKVDAGARFLITQLFFDSGAYWDFVARARDLGIEVPIVPGIMPITNFEQITRFTQMCGATIPAPLMRELGLRAGRLRRRLRDAAVRGAARQGRPGHPLLHAQQVSRHARDPQRPARPRPVAGRRACIGATSRRGSIRRW
jgi:methylenetetrahydrofolate reductase (NADPH)